MNDSAYASNTNFMKTIQHEIDRIEESAASIPGFIEAKIGSKPNRTLTLTHSPVTSIV